jgi:calcium/calmodulin-dependent protein kinase I
MKPYKKLGKGNFGTVYLVQRLTDGKEMAAKAFLKYNLQSMEHGQDLLLTEISVMRACSHRGVLQLHEVYET